jgi:hypothetical protein
MPICGLIMLSVFDFAMDNLTDPQRRASLAPQLSTRRLFYSIHPAKIDAELAKYGGSPEPD